MCSWPSGSIKDFPPLNPADFNAVPVTLYVWIDGFNPPPMTDPKADPKAEPVKKAEPIKLEFGRTDGDTIYVRRTLPGPNGAVNAFTLPATIKVGAGTETVEVLPAVTKSRLDLLDRSLPSFSDTTRITVAGANNYVLARDEKPDPSTKEILWRFAAPDTRVGQVADGKSVRDDIMYFLGNASSHIGRFVDETPSPEKLAEWGLAPTPRLKATIALPSDPTAPKQIVFEFGKDTADPNFVYARVEGKVPVFTLSRSVFDKLVTVDLRDRVIARAMPPAQVNKVKLKGWGGIEMLFEKNAAGVWEAKPPTPATFAVDPAKVSAFVELVARMQAQTFEKGPAEGKHGFGDAKTAFEATLSWPGGAYSVTLGARSTAAHRTTPRPRGWTERTRCSRSRPPRTSPTRTQPPASRSNRRRSPCSAID